MEYGQENRRDQEERWLWLCGGGRAGRESDVHAGGALLQNPSKTRGAEKRGELFLSVVKVSG
eukprot:763158-Hanusia_phi.AAC.2